MKKISVVLLVFLIGMVFTLCSRASLSSNIGITWIKYSGNPLDLGPGRLNRPWVIYDEHMYKMWYENDTIDGEKIYFADSPDGIVWTQHGIVLDKEAGSWDNDGVGEPIVLFDGTIYRMWYLGRGGPVASVGYATSSDGLLWTRYESNPVLVPGGNGGWDDWSIGGIKVIFNGTHYRMWYGAQAVRDGVQKIGAATSVDGISWTKYSGNPVLVPSLSGWDSHWVFAGPVIMNGSNYAMWYTGDGPVVPPGVREHSIGLATSPDGFSWTKYKENPVLTGTPGSWDALEIRSSCVVKQRSRLLMFYYGLNGIGLAISYAPYTLAEVDFNPESLNLRSKGRWITCYIELPEGYDVNDINVTTVMLNDTVPAELRPTEVGDYDDDGIPDLMVKFDRAEVISYILANVNMTKLFEERFMTVTLTITGKLNDDTPFQGSDTIRIALPVHGKQGIFLV